MTSRAKVTHLNEIPCCETVSKCDRQTIVMSAACEACSLQEKNAEIALLPTGPLVNFSLDFQLMHSTYWTGSEAYCLAAHHDPSGLFQGEKEMAQSRYELIRRALGDVFVHSCKERTDTCEDVLSKIPFVSVNRVAVQSKARPQEERPRSNEDASLPFQYR